MHFRGMDTQCSLILEGWMHIVHLERWIHIVHLEGWIQCEF